MIYLTNKYLFEDDGKMPVFNKKYFKMERVAASAGVLGVLFTAKDVQNIAKMSELTFVEAIEKYNFSKVASDEGISLYVTY